LIEYLTDPCRYDKWSRPTNDSSPTVVSVRILVYFIGSIEAQNLQFTVQMLVSYRWIDPRLNHTGPIIEGEGTLRDKLWTPHLYLVNEHDSKVMGSGQADVLISIDTDGTVSYTTRLKATLLCLMNLKKFPFDNQKCPLVLESWSYNTSQLVLEWESDSAVVMKSERQLTEYTLVDIKTDTSVTDYSINEMSTEYQHQHYQSKFAGNYSCVIVQFLLEREVGHYIMDYYVPSIFLVVVSWVSFWLDPNAVPGRTTLGTSTMLTFITLSRNIGSSLPKVSYVKATEIWFIVCTAFIFGSLVEFAFVNTIWRRRKNVELKKVSSKYILKSTLTPQLKRKEVPRTIDRSQSFSSLDESKLSSSGVPKAYNSQLTVTSIDSISRDPFPFKALSDDSLNISVPIPEAPPANRGWFTMTPQEIAQWIDKRSRIIFPVAFIIFNLLYWIFVWF
ncbi:hypothetical protein AAG570_012762, partial [Ranatra chinensis]